ncbi:MAG: hypothetical protein JW863_13595, partial [Chitinispirillaceae bacterium]|nr:hypothetical protein [Chitinispirillaceae bacterium]
MKAAEAWCSCCVLFFFLPVIHAASITVTENTAERFSFSWEMDDFDTTSCPDGNGGRLMSLGFSGSTIALGEYGEAVLPGVALNVGVPADGFIDVTVSPSEMRTVRLSGPVETWREAGAEGRLEGVSFPGRWFSTPQYSFYRTQRVARILLRPVVYDPASRSVTLLERGTVTITLPPADYRNVAINPKSDYESMLRHLIINYDVAKGFRRSASPGKRTAAADYPFPYGIKAYTFRIGDGHEGLNEGMTDENGIMKLPGNRIRELFGAVAMEQVQLFAACKGMLPDTLPTDGTIPDGIVEIPLLRVDRNGNGTVDDDDYFVTCVTGASDWAYSDISDDYRYALDWYDDYRTYWLAIAGGGLPVGKLAGQQSTPDTARTSFVEYRHYRQSKARGASNKGNRKWIWKTLSDRSDHFEEKLTLPGYIPGETIGIRFAGEKRGGAIALSLGDENLCTACDSGTTYPVESGEDHTLLFTLIDDGNERPDTFELECFTVKYPRELVIGDDPVQLQILPPVRDSGYTASYRLTVNTHQKLWLFRTSRDGCDIALVDTLTFPERGVYAWIDSAPGDCRYMLCNESGLFELPEVAKPAEATGKYACVVHDLRSSVNTTDFLIVSPPEFLAAADSLARHKKKIGFSNPVVVDVNDLYRFFSGGDKDAGAIRNFIGYVSRYWKGGEALDYVFFMGTGHYDSKHYATSADDLIPVYINGNICREDFFTCVSGRTSGIAKPGMALGRLPCNSIDQAWNIVRKIVQMEDPAIADMSGWRNRMLFVADDDRQGLDADRTGHHRSSDNTASLIDSLWPSMDIRKVTLFEYPWNESLQKPGASRALINEINNGVGYVNFFGHGADITWTDEYILTPDMVTGMNNTGRYPVVAAFSCSVGRFDTPGKECLSGVLARAAGVGSIASISSTRESYATSNEYLAKSFYGHLFNTSAFTTIGMALIMAVGVSSGSEYRKYCILGDPSVRPVRPTHRISLTINGRSEPVSVKAMEEILISGTVERMNGGGDGSFGGSGAYVALGLFNAPDSASRKDNGADKTIRYTLPGTPVFMGKVPVKAGKFSQAVLLPQNLSFDKPGVKLTACAWKEHDTLAAVGSRRDIVFHGSASLDSIDDVSGPRITVRPAYDNDRLSGG